MSMVVSYHLDLGGKFVCRMMLPIWNFHHHIEGDTMV